MKKILLSMTLLGIACASKAQSIPNAGMESWHNYSSAGLMMTTPNEWISVDSIYRLYLQYLVPTGTYVPMVTKETTLVHTGTSAAKLTSTLQADSTVYTGILVNGLITFDESDPEVLLAEGGLYVSDRIEKVSAWLSYNPADVVDGGMMVVTAIQDGTAANGGDSIMGSGITYIYGAISYTKFDCPIAYTGPSGKPDRLVIQFSSSSDTAINGTTLYVDDVTMTSPTGIETPLFNGETVSVYPNPATDVLHISSSIKTPARFDVYALTGQLVLQKNMQGSADLNLNTLAAGNYVYQVYTQDGKTKLFEGRFAKQ